MYKCRLCREIFNSPQECRIETEYYPRPFGNGYEPYGHSQVYEGCPYCESPKFEEIEWDEEHCPFCGFEISELIGNLDIENFEYICPKCSVKITIKDGRLE